MRMNTRVKNLLKSLEKTRSTYWNIAPETGAFLSLIIQDRNYKKVLEIGTSNGYSAIWMAQALEKTGGQLWTIESNFKKRFPLATENFQKSGLKNITQILGHAPEAIPKTPQKFDLAFFDATKGEHIDYFNALKSRIKKGGLIITDNISSHKKEFQDYIKVLQKDPDFTSTILEIDQGLMLSFRN
jgi:predicted O-methyltransferase YrrM